MGHVTSRDGTTIAFDRAGDGPPVVLVDGALCFRAFGPLPSQAEVLASDFTVYTYDRRGRGESSDTAPYAVAREVEDLAALIAEAGGSACVYAVSSGAALALEAAATGAPISRLAVFEPPYTVEAGEDPHEKQASDDQLTELLAAGRHGDAVEMFLGFVMPPGAVAEMRTLPVWPMLETVAPTLGYDTVIMGDGTVPRERFRDVSVPTLVVDSAASPDVLRVPSRVVADVVPDATYRTLEGASHEIAPEKLAPVLKEHFL